MTPDQLNDLSQKLTDHARSQAIAWLEGEAAIGGTVDEEIVEFLARQDVPWERLTVEQQDGLRDQYLESWKLTCSQSLLVTPETLAEESLVADSQDFVPKIQRAITALTEAYEHVSLRFEGNLTNNGNMGTAVRKLGEGIDILNKLSETPTTVSSGEVVVVERILVKDAVEALEWAWMLIDRIGPTWKESASFKFHSSTLSRLRSLLLQPPLGGPEGVLPLQGASLSQGTDVLPIGGRTPQEWLDKYLDTDQSWLLEAYHNERVVHEALKRSANSGKSVPDMYKFLSRFLLIAYQKQFNLNLKMAELSPTVPVQLPVGGEAV